MICPKPEALYPKSTFTDDTATYLPIHRDITVVYQDEQQTSSNQIKETPHQEKRNLPASPNFAPVAIISFILGLITIPLHT